MNIEYKFLRLFTNQLLDHSGQPTGVHLGCDDIEVCKQSHVDGKISPIIHEWVDTGEVYRLEEEIETLEAQRDQLLEALKLALSSHGVMLTSYPPQDAWKFYGVEEKGRAAIKAVEEGK